MQNQKKFKEKKKNNAGGIIAVILGLVFLSGIVLGFLSDGFKNWDTGTWKPDTVSSPAPVKGEPGADGLSAYDIWLSLGNTGTESDFIASLTGPDGADGQNGASGADGQSAYDIWLSLGNTGTEADFIASLKGPAGTDGIGSGKLYHHNIRFKISPAAQTFFAFDIYNTRSAEYTSMQEFLSENAGRQWGVSGICLVDYISYIDPQLTGYAFISRIQSDGYNMTLFMTPCNNLSLTSPFIVTLNWMQFPEEGSFATTVWEV